MVCNTAFKRLWRAGLKQLTVVLLQPSSCCPIKRVTAAVACAAALSVLWPLPLSQAASTAKAQTPALCPGFQQGLPQPFKQAKGTRSWRFPRDHGRHDGYRLEWWYYVGGLRTPTGRRFGFQLTFFRQLLPQCRAASPGAQGKHRSAWHTQALVLGHAALSDVKNRRHLKASLLEREALGLAETSAKKHHLQLRNWRVVSTEPSQQQLQLIFAGKEGKETFQVRLNLQAKHPPVLHGKQGLDAKGAQPGQASWYYSLPKMTAQGTVTLAGKRHLVKGWAWMDHEFGSSWLSANTQGWDWFALQLNSGEALMLYRLRQAPNPRQGTPQTEPQGGLAAASTSPFSAGSWIDAQGRAHPLRINTPGPNRVDMTPLGSWRNSRGDAYPLEWQLRAPSLGLTLRVSPAFSAQEQHSTKGVPFSYWEGLVFVSGQRQRMKTPGHKSTTDKPLKGKNSHPKNLAETQTTPIQGEGYMELTGYSGAPIAQSFQ